ncbi:hypothetical protein CcCBS67573_g08184 [Chytriomyces confervae]|uniref:HIG1 domain-containing protein n=1 Tax=Chytriomyces confervae TaxID=246404 RepID=A0A507EN35_9FUNG|nr:hypothetical protein CcCBS67573_g08184 [Chytriomyces confervae]
MSVSMGHHSQDLVIPDKMEAHRLRREEKDKIHGQVLIEGAKMGMVTTAGALAASFGLNHYSALFRGLTLPFKISLVLAATTAGFFTETDRAAMKADREFAKKFSISQEDEVQLKSSNPFKLNSSEWDMEQIKNAAFKNKFVNARLVGQFSAVAGVLLIGAAAAGGRSTEKELDPYYERIVGGEEKRNI